MAEVARLAPADRHREVRAVELAGGARRRPRGRRAAAAARSSAADAGALGLEFAVLGQHGAALLVRRRRRRASRCATSALTRSAACSRGGRGGPAALQRLRGRGGGLLGPPVGRGGDAALLAGRARASVERVDRAPAGSAATWSR